MTMVSHKALIHQTILRVKSNYTWYIFFRYLRMSPNRFEHLLSMIAPLIQKQETKMRKPISAAEQLVITLRYLATGDAQQSLSFAFRIGKSTVSNIISETTMAIFKV